MKFALIHEKKANHTIGYMTRLLGVSRAGYYAWFRWRGASSSSRRRQDELKAQIAKTTPEKKQSQISERISILSSEHIFE